MECKQIPFESKAWLHSIFFLQTKAVQRLLISLFAWCTQQNSRLVQKRYMPSTLLYFLHKLLIEDKLLRESPSIASKVALNPLTTVLLRNSNLTWIEFPLEYTGGGRFWPQILKSLGFPSCEATFVIKTRALSGAAPAQSSFSPATRVKYKKVSLMIFPLSTVIFQVHVLLAS